MASQQQRQRSVSRNTPEEAVVSGPHDHYHEEDIQALQEPHRPEESQQSNGQSQEFQPEQQQQPTDFGQNVQEEEDEEDFETDTYREKFQSARFHLGALVQELNLLVSLCRFDEEFLAHPHVGSVSAHCLEKLMRGNLQMSFASVYLGDHFGRHLNEVFRLMAEGFRTPAMERLMDDVLNNKDSTMLHLGECRLWMIRATFRSCHDMHVYVNRHISKLASNLHMMSNDLASFKSYLEEADLISLGYAQGAGWFF